MNEDFSIYEFANGIRLIHKQALHTQIAHCGIVLDIGSRDEEEEEVGLAHFWEHMAFKGTKKRRAFHISNRIDAVGGDLNAFTTKEHICFYASVLERHLERAIDIICDITFESIFPEREIEKERSVILEEMAMYRDNPSDAIDDEFDEVFFGKHPLGRQILGTVESVKRFQKQDFIHFIEKHLDTERLVLSVVSPQDFKTVKKIVEKYIKDVPPRTCCRLRLPPAEYQPQEHIVYRPVSQSHAVLGLPSYSIADTDKLIPFMMLVNLLGGSGLNSRLNMILRERHGLVYGVDASYVAFSDVGYTTINFATESKNLGKSLQLIEKELKKLCEVPLGSIQLHTAKQQLMGQIAMGAESNSSTMLGIGKTLVTGEPYLSMQDIFERIEQIETKILMDIAQEILIPEKMSRLFYLPE
ncbi:MAG: insulinase family protein [Bernardetiaceae bacterium]|nr:insulinase family protein [Bernardetiaceae bacterium]